MMLIWKSLILGWCFFASTALAADNISERVLANGLKIIVKPDHRSPVVVFQIWYKVGSAYEREAYTGISHLLEHLMYRGIKNPLLDVVYQKMSSIGSKGNAYTSKDHTFYYHILSNQYLGLAFAVEAERMKHLAIDPSEFIIEKNVIREEWFDNISRDPYLPASNALYQYAFQHEAYQFPVIGRMEDQDALTMAQVINWHNNYYTPDNATLVIVGDIKPSEAFALARKYFAPIKNRAWIPEDQFFPKKNSPAEKKCYKNKHETCYIKSGSSEAVLILLAFKVPSIKTSEPAWEAYALDILAGWLDSGLHSRLTEALVRDRRVAHEVFVDYSPMNRKKSLFIIEATPALNVSVAQLEQAIIEEIKLIKTELISQKTLQRLKNQMIATEIFDRDSMYIQAKIIGQAESVDIHWSEDRQYISRIKAVTAGQIKTVLQRYIDLHKKFIVIQDGHDNKQD